MTELTDTSTGYSLTQGDPVIAIYSASNGRGPGDFSDPNTEGVVAQEEPPDPVLPPSRGERTTETQVNLLNKTNEYV
jgi:hypothetical protein